MEEQNNQLELLSMNKAAKLMKISRSTLRTLINDGKIGIIPIGRQNKIPIRELFRFQESQIIKQEHLPIISKTTFNTKLAPIDRSVSIKAKDIKTMLDEIMHGGAN